MKYSKSFNRDYEFYFKHKDKFTFCGCRVEPFTFDSDSVSVSAKKAFHIWDSTGEIVETYEPILVRQLITTKKAINLQIKEWAIGYDDLIMAIPEYMESFDEPPKWVEKSLREQRYKEYKKKHG